jgi:CysZ protein
MSSVFTSPSSQIGLGLHYFLCGWRLLFQRNLLPFVLFPLLINILLVSGLVWFFLANIGGWLAWLLPTWLDWLSWIIVPMVLLLIAVGFYFAFTTLANFIAAPFNSLLAEKVEQQLTGENLTEMSTAELLKDVPRMLKREWLKMWYSIPRLVAIFLLGLVPFLGQTIVPILAFLFGAWMLAIQYCDYPFDNHKIHFQRMRNALYEKRLMNFSFGSLVSLFTMLPFVNLVVMPVAVCGATAMWVNEYRDFFLDLAQQAGKNSTEIAIKAQGRDVENVRTNGNSSITPRN